MPYFHTNTKNTLFFFMCVVLAGSALLHFSHFLDAASHLPFATVHVPFLINTLALFYNFGKSWKSDPGIIKASEEQKKKVCLSVS